MPDRRQQTAGDSLGKGESPADLPLADADVPDADPESVARTILLRRLDAAPRTRAELAGDLRKRNVPDDVAERVLDRFTEVGLIDDATYAQMWVASRQRTRGAARPVLRQELRRKGIADETVAAALAEVDPADEAERARDLVARKLPSLARYDVATRKRRLVSMLVRRGYGQGLAFGIVRDALADATDDDTLDMS